MLILPADHHVANEEVFRGVIQAAARIAEGAEAEWPSPLVTLGIKPTGPETGYGYIVPDQDSSHELLGVRAYRATAFVEKPDRARAEALARETGSGVELGHLRGPPLDLRAPARAPRSGRLRAGP